MERSPFTQSIVRTPKAITTCCGMVKSYMANSIRLRIRDSADYLLRSGQRLGLVMLNHPRRFARDPRDRSLRVGAIGLGVGTIAAYGMPGDYIRFYEINPPSSKSRRMRMDTSPICGIRARRIDIVPGDARLSMERELANGTPQAFDVLVLDAFSGDAIPVHLLTIEAFEIYLRELSPDGVIAIHVTNRYLDLQPVIREIANHFGLKSAAHASVRRADGQTQRLDSSCAQQFSARPSRDWRAS